MNIYIHIQEMDLLVFIKAYFHQYIAVHRLIFMSYRLLSKSISGKHVFYCK